MPSYHVDGGRTGQNTWDEEGLKAIGFAQGEISSLMIPKDMTADLYTGSEMTGDKRSFVGDDFLDANQRMFCQNVLDTDFKASVKSAAVGNAKSLWKAYGSWEQIATITDQDSYPSLYTTVNYGFDTATTDVERLSESISLQ